MLAKDGGKTPEEIIQYAQEAASRMSVTLLKVAENVEQEGTAGPKPAL